MPKECNCSVEETGLPTLYPANHDYCFRCGKRLEYVTEEEISKRWKKLMEKYE